MIQEMIQTVENANNFSYTENGAAGYSTTGKKLVDLNFRLPSMRNVISLKDLTDFEDAMEEDLVYAIKWMFYVRDIRGGVGERNSFIKLFNIFHMSYPKEAISCIELIAEYGRWKDVVDIAFFGSEELQYHCMLTIVNQLKKDTAGFVEGKPISLLAKWLPSINASSKARERAKKICSYLAMNYKEYRQMLSKLRAYLDVTEVKTCANKWNEIDYNKVSSNANLKYSDAFLKHDEERRIEYLNALKSGNPSVKINAATLFPHEIWSKYTKGYYTWRDSITVNQIDDTLEELWKNLPEMGECGNTLVVVDGSGSMCGKYNGDVEPLSVSRSLGVYFAERCTGEFHNKMIEFSERPQIIDIDGCETLMDKINQVGRYTDCSNTNIERVFDLVLTTATKNNMKQEDMPERIVIVSDMEFDSMTYSYRNSLKTLFEQISDKYKMSGYKMPKLIFWNVASRTNTIPMTENELGVVLLSGYSVNLLKMVMSNQTDTWLALKEILDSPRYDAIVTKLKGNG